MARKKGKESKTSGRPTRYNWDIIRKEYIYGYKNDNKLHHPSYSDLAQRWGMSLGAVSKRGTQEDWVQQKKDAMKAEGRKIMKAREKDLIDESLRSEKQEIQITKILRSICYAKLTEQRVGDNGEINYIPNLDIDTNELRSICKVFETAHTIRDNITKSVFMEYDRYVRENDEEEQPKFIVQLPKEYVQKYENSKKALDGEFDEEEDRRIDSVYKEVTATKLDEDLES